MEKLVYLLWGPTPKNADDTRRLLLEDVAPRLLKLDPRGLQINVDDADSSVPAPVPVPESELPLLAQVSLWLDAHDYRAPYEAILAEVGVRRAGYLVSEALYTDYGRNENHPAPRDWPDGKRSPGVLTVALVQKPPHFEYENWYGHWYGHQSPMSQWTQPRMRYVRNTITRRLTPGAPPYDGIVEEGWPSRGHVSDPHLFYNSGGSDEKLREHARIMMDSVTHMFDLTKLRSFTLSEYLLKTV